MHRPLTGKVVIATHNAGKLREMKELLAPFGVEAVSAGELNLRKFFERAGSRRELVLAFLSVLELVPTTEIFLIQQETFGEIVAHASA